LAGRNGRANNVREIKKKELELENLGADTVVLQQAKSTCRKLAGSNSVNS